MLGALPPGAPRRGQAGDPAGRAFDEHGNPELFAHYGDILNALGDRFSAEFYWQKALDAGYDAAEIRRRMESTPSAEKPAR